MTVPPREWYALRPVPAMKSYATRGLRASGRARPAPENFSHAWRRVVPVALGAVLLKHSAPMAASGIIGPATNGHGSIGDGGTAMDGHDSLKAARAPGAQVRAWLLDMLPVAPGWKTAGVLEAARVEAGIGKRALRTARERLLADGAIEKDRDGFQGPFRYRRVERAAVAESEAAPGPEAAGVRAVPEAPEIPERFAATLRFLAGAPVPEDFDRMAFIQSLMSQLRNAVERDGPRLMAAPNDDPTLDCFLVKVALDTLARDCGYSLTIRRLDRR